MCACVRACVRDGGWVFGCEHAYERACARALTRFGACMCVPREIDMYQLIRNLGEREIRKDG